MARLARPPPPPPLGELSARGKATLAALRRERDEALQLRRALALQRSAAAFLSSPEDAVARHLEQSGAGMCARLRCWPWVPGRRAAAARGGDDDLAEDLDLE